MCLQLLALLHCSCYDIFPVVDLIGLFLCGKTVIYSFARFTTVVLDWHIIFEMQFISDKKNAVNFFSQPHCARKCLGRPITGKVLWTKCVSMVHIQPRAYADRMRPAQLLALWIWCQSSDPTAVCRVSKPTAGQLPLFTANDGWSVTGVLHIPLTTSLVTLKNIEIFL